MRNVTIRVVQSCFHSIYNYLQSLFAVGFVLLDFMCMLCISLFVFFPFGHCVDCSSSIYVSWLPLCYLLAIVLTVLLRFTYPDYPFGIFWPLCWLFFFDLRILITPLVSSNSSCCVYVRRSLHVSAYHFT